ncbi:MAG: ABC transporter permease [Flavobacteriaceae bacterium]|nr:ABC transporter permease [Flavobacteriaceae bacterium]
MFNRDTWKEIFLGIRKNKLRTFLSGFSVALGIFLFVMLFGFGNGLINTFDKFFQDDATNVFFIRRGRTSMPYKGYKSQRLIELDNSDMQDIRDNFPMFLEFISPRIFRGVKATYNNQWNNYTNRAVAPGHQFAEKTIMMYGRFLNQEDIKNKTKVAVIGRMVRKDLFGSDNPIGKFIDLNGVNYRVVGVFQDDGGDNEERMIYTPYTTQQQLEKSTDEIDQIVLGFKPSIGYAGAMQFDRQLTKFLKDKKKIHPDDRRGIFIRNIADDLKQNQQFAKVLQMIVSFVALGTIIAGIIGISNVMVFTVKERTKEIGIRKALGATPKDVIAMILLESVFITTVSGVIGLMLGIAVLSSLGETLEDFFITNPYIDTFWALFATIILICFGALAGYMPARRAARIHPIVALRDE